MRAAARVGADQHPPPQVSGAAGPGPASWPRYGRRRCSIRRCPAGAGLPAAPRSPPGRDQRRRSAGDSQTSSSRWCRVLFLRARGHNRRVHVDGDQAAVRAGRRVAGQFPGPRTGGRPRGPDRLQRRPARRRPGARSAGRPPGPRRPARTAPAGATQHRHVRQAVPAQRHRHRQVGDDLPRVVHRPGGPPPFQATSRPWSRPVTRSVWVSSRPPAWETIPVPSADTTILRRRAVRCTRKVPFELERTGLSPSPILPGQRHFSCLNDQAGPTARRKAEASTSALADPRVLLEELLHDSTAG